MRSDIPEVSSSSGWARCITQRQPLSWDFSPSVLKLAQNLEEEHEYGKIMENKQNLVRGSK